MVGIRFCCDKRVQYLYSGRLGFYSDHFWDSVEYVCVLFSVYPSSPSLNILYLGQCEYVCVLFIHPPPPQYCILPCLNLRFWRVGSTTL